MSTVRIENRKREIVQIAVLIALLFVVAAILYRRMLFGDMTLVFRDSGSDTFHSYWPAMEYFVRHVQRGEMGFWMFQSGFGNSIISFLHYMTDPLTLLLFLFPEGTMAYGLVGVAVLKIIAAGLLLYLYCRELGFTFFPSSVAAIIWAFCGYMILWGQHYWFASVTPLFALMMLGEARLRHGKGGKLFVFAIWMTLVNFIYFAVWFTIALLIIVLLEYILQEKKSIRDFCSYIWMFFWRGCLAVALAAFRVIPEILFLVNSARFSNSDMNHNGLLLNGKELLDEALRFFSNNALGMPQSENALGYNYYEQIMLACSVLTLIFALHNIIVRKGKERRFCILSGVFVLASLTTRIGSYLMNVGKGDSWRWTFLIIFALIINLAFALQDMMDHGKKRVFLFIVEIAIAVLFFATTFFVFIHRYGMLNTEEDLIIITIVMRGIGVFLLAYATLLLIWCISQKGKMSEKVQGRVKKVFEVGMLLTVCIEMVVLNDMTINNRITMSKEAIYSMEYYDPGSTESISWIRSQDDGLYRIEKTYLVGIGNDPLLMEYYGTSMYALEGKEGRGFSQHYGFLLTGIGDGTSPITGYPLLESLVGIKYMISNMDFAEPGYEKLHTVDKDHVIYQNQNALPLLYTTDQLTAEQIAEMAETNSGDISGILPYVNSMDITSFRDDKIEGTVKVSGDGRLITSIAYDRGWEIRADGEKVKPELVNMGFLGATIPEGTHEIKLVYFPYGMKTGIIISIVAVIVTAFIVVWKKRKTDEKNKCNQIVDAGV